MITTSDLTDSKKAAPEEHFIVVNNLRIRFLQEGKGPELILLHGFSGCAEALTPLSQYLTDEFRVIRIDLIGHGDSSAPYDLEPYKMGNCTDTLVSILDKLGLKSTNPANLFGYSMGGRVALGLAAYYPSIVRKLAVLGSTAGIEDPLEQAKRRRDDLALARFIEARGIEAFVDRWMAHPLLVSQKKLGKDFLEQARTLRLRNKPHGLSLSLQGMGTGAQEPVHERLAQTTIPILLMAGENDEKFRQIAVNLAIRLTNAKTIIIEDAGHAAHLESPETVSRELKKFFRPDS